MALAYNHISSNRKKTWLLVVLFPISFAFLVYLGIIVYNWSMLKLMRPSDIARTYAEAYAANVQNPLFFMSNELAVYIIPIALGAAVLWLILSYFWGADIMMTQTNATEITIGYNRQLYRLVENLCITRGMPLPKIYVINDTSLNAFATGRNPHNAIIAVTEGLLENLDKSELQGVVAHELAHIENRDATIMLLAIEGIAMFTFLGEIMLRTSGRLMQSRGGIRLCWIVFLAGLVCALFGYLIAPLLRLAVSRQREFLADAASALTTRNPQALASALEKISQKSRVAILKEHPSMAAMCIAAPKEIESSFFNRLSGLYASHPPVAERIKRLKQMDFQ